MDKLDNLSIGYSTGHKSCENCGVSFRPRRITKRFCSGRCRYLAFVGKIEDAQLTEETRQVPQDSTVKSLNQQESVKLGLPTILDKRLSEPRHLRVESVLINAVSRLVNLDQIRNLKLSIVQGDSSLIWLSTCWLGFLEFILQISSITRLDRDKVIALQQGFNDLIGDPRFKVNANSYNYSIQLFKWANSVQQIDVSSKNIQLILPIEKKIVVMTMAFELRSAGFITLPLNELPLKTITNLTT